MLVTAIIRVATAFAFGLTAILGFAMASFKAFTEDPSVVTYASYSSSS